MKSARSPRIGLFDDPDPTRPPVRRVRRGVDVTVKALRDTGRIEPVDTALVALARTLADAIDDEHTRWDGSSYKVANLAGRLHPVIADLRGEGFAAFGSEIDALLRGMSADARGYGEP